VKISDSRNAEIRFGLHSDIKCQLNRSMQYHLIN
jgi:hypothetical protein